MKALLLDRPSKIEERPLRLSEVSIPTQAETEILVKVEACGVCRTDLHVVEGDLKQVRSPVIPGHEIVGRVAKVGREVRNLKVGDVVGVPWLHKTCGRCEFCLSGRENLCERKEFTGYSVDGGYAEYVVADANYSFKLPSDVDPVAFAPLLCAGIIGYRSFKMTNAPKNGRIALFGFGASAHIITQLMVKMGYGVIGISNSEQHVELARKLGASEAYASKESYKNIAKCDSAVVFAPVGELVLEALSILKPGGRAVIAGIHMSTIPPIDYDRLLFNERGIVSVEANTREDASEFLELAAKFGIKSAYNKMPFNRANEALQELKAGKVNGVNVLSGWT